MTFGLVWRMSEDVEPVRVREMTEEDMLDVGDPFRLLGGPKSYCCVGIMA